VKYIILSILVLFSLSAYSQIEDTPLFVGKYFGNQSGGGSGYWQVTGNFTDESGYYDATSIQVGDVLFFVDAGIGYHLPVTSIISASGSSFTIRVNNTGISGVAGVPNGPGGIYRANSPKGIWPFTAGLTASDQQTLNSFLIKRLNNEPVKRDTFITVPHSTNYIPNLVITTPSRFYNNIYISCKGISDTSTVAFLAAPTSDHYGVVYNVKNDSGLVETRVLSDAHLSNVKTSYLLRRGQTAQVRALKDQAQSGAYKWAVNLLWDSVVVSGGGSGITALTGDVTASGTGSVAATIANDAVTSAKIASNAIDSTKAANLSPNDLAQTGASTGQVLTWTGSKYAPRTSSSAVTIIKSTNKDSIGITGNLVKDNDNSNAVPTYQVSRMKNTAKAISTLGSSGFNIALIGDSKTERIGEILASIYPEFQKHFTFSGFGLVQASTFFAPVLNNAVSPNFQFANWTLKDRNSGGRGLGLFSAVSTVSSTAFGWIGQANTNEFSKWNTISVNWWGQVGGGSFEVRVDGVLAGTINTSSATGFQTTTYTGYTDIETHTVLITPLGANVEIMGIVLSRTGINGVRLNRMGQTSAVTADYTVRADTALWNAQLRQLNPKLCIINLGSNEILRDTSLAGFKREAKKFITQIKKALSYNVDIMWVGVTPMSGPTYTRTLEYVDVVRQLCLEDTISMVDPGLYFGPYLASAGLYADGVHESALGGAVVSKAIVSGLTMWLNEENFANKYLKQFGNTTPLSTSGHTINKLPFINSSGVFSTFGGPGYDGISVTFTGNMTAGNTVSGLNVRNSTAPYSNGNNFSAPGSMGYFGFTAGESTFTAGFTAGIRMDGTHTTVRFQSSNQASILDSWRFEPFTTSAWRQWVTGSSIIRMAQGFDNNGNGGTAAFFRSNNSINQYTNVRTTIKDMYFETIRTSPILVNHISINNKWGDNYFNSQSNSTAIGVLEDTVTHHPTINRSAKLQVGGTDKGFLLPVVTTAQRDSIKTNGIQKIVIGSVGSGYTSDPIITISGGGGSFATATPYRNASNALAVVDVLNPGRGYTSVPTVTITGGGGSGATATATLYSSEGLQVYNSTTKTIDVFRNGIWTSTFSGFTASATLDFGSTAAGASTDLTITVTGAADGDVVSLGVPNASVTATGRYFAWVSATNTVTVRFSPTILVGSEDPGSGVFKVTVTK